MQSGNRVGTFRHFMFYDRCTLLPYMNGWVCNSFRAKLALSVFIQNTEHLCQYFLRQPVGRKFQMNQSCPTIILPAVVDAGYRHCRIFSTV